MRKVYFLAILSLLQLVTPTAKAQIVSDYQLNNYIRQRFSSKWTEAADYLSLLITLDKSGGLTYDEVIDAPGKTKEQLYILLHHWYATTFNDPYSSITLDDKSLGVVIAQGCLLDVAGHLGGANAYYISLQPIIKCDIRDNKVRVTFTIPYYTITRDVNGGIVTMIANTMTGSPQPVIRVDDKWTIGQCYPFVQKDPHKKASSKALIAAYACSNIVMDNIRKCIKGGLIGNEGESW